MFYSAWSGLYPQHAKKHTPVIVDLEDLYTLAKPGIFGSVKGFHSDYLEITNSLYRYGKPLTRV